MEVSISLNNFSTEYTQQPSYRLEQKTLY